MVIEPPHHVKVLYKSMVFLRTIHPSQKPRVYWFTSCFKSFQPQEIEARLHIRLGYIQSNTKLFCIIQQHKTHLANKRHQFSSARLCAAALTEGSVQAASFLCRRGLLFSQALSFQHPSLWYLLISHLTAALPSPDSQLLVHNEYSSRQKTIARLMRICSCTHTRDDRTNRILRWWHVTMSQQEKR